MVIELDGHIHRKQKNYDQIRTEILDFKNVIVLRFKNEEIISNFNTALKNLKEAILKIKKDL